MRILITSVGGVTGIVFIRSLQMAEEDAYIVGVDANQFAAGFKFVEKAYEVPLASKEDEYISSLTQICEREEIDLLVPLMDEELPVVAANKERFEAIGVRVAIPSEKTIRNCLDKFLTSKLLGELFAKTSPADNIKSSGIDCPLVLKPISGRGSQDVYICKDEDELRVLEKRVTKPIVQEYLLEPEYTVDMLSNLSGEPLIAIPRRRYRVKAGVTWQGWVELREDVQRLCERAGRKLRLLGPSCIQVRFTKEGKPKIFEVNPRIGGTTILTVYSGVNIPYLASKLFLGENVKIPSREEIDDQVVISRFIDAVTFRKTSPLAD